MDQDISAGKPLRGTGCATLRGVLGRTSAPWESADGLCGVGDFEREWPDTEADMEADIEADINVVENRI